MSHYNIISHLSLRMVTVTIYNPIPGWKRIFSHNADNMAEKPFRNTKLRSQNTTRSCLFSAASILVADSSACLSSNCIPSLCSASHSFILPFFKKTSLHNNIGKKVRIRQGSSAFKIECINSRKYIGEKIYMDERILVTG